MHPDPLALPEPCVLLLADLEGLVDLAALALLLRVLGYWGSHRWWWWLILVTLVLIFWLWRSS